MPVRRPAAVIEPLELRSHLSAAALTVLVPHQVILNKSGTLAIIGTNADDSVRIRAAAGRKIALTVTSVISTGGKRLVPAEGETFLVGQSVLTPSDKPTAVTTTFSLDRSAVRRLQMEGRDGQDAFTISKLALPTTLNAVERGVIAQSPAPAGAKPWDPAPGQKKGLESNWLRQAAEQKRAADASKSWIGFFGDSHMERYLYHGRKSWNAYFSKALNLGISGDSSRQLLYRIKNGLFDVFQPEKLVLMFGTNNFNNPLTSGTDAEVAAGVKAVIDELRQRLPDTKLILFSVLPRNEPGIAERVKTLNQFTPSLADGRNVFFLDVYKRFEGRDIQRTLYMPDRAHISDLGYRVLTASLMTFLKDMKRQGL
ncbi:MAG TPA: GDSL-type esterase/lipase family protein [Tepidisphaeraceae bacterium]|jgi:lysophospholipase L1-like esterase